MKKIDLKFVKDRVLDLIGSFIVMLMSALMGIVVLSEFVRSNFSLAVIYGFGLSLMILAVLFLIVAGAWQKEKS